MKILTKNFLNTSGLTVLIITIAFFILYFMLPNYYQKIKEAEIQEIVSELTLKIKGQPHSEETSQLLAEKSLYGDIMFVLKDKHKDIIYPKKTDDITLINLLNFQMEKVSKQDTPQLSGGEDTDDIGATAYNDDFHYLSYTESFGDNYTLNAVFPLQPIDEAQQVLLAIYPLVLTISFLIGAICTYVYSYFATKRLKLISEITRKMIVSSDVKIYQIKGNDEIKQLSEDINYMHGQLVATNEKLSHDLDLISKLENHKTEFMQIASHELKTPVTALTGIIEGMIYEIGPYKDRDKYLIVCQELITEQTNLIKDILNISRIDVLEEPVKTSFFLDELIKQELVIFKTMMMSHEHVLEINLEPIEITANQDEMRRIISNLISNAVKYTAKGGAIAITLTKNEFQLKNECEPLDDAVLERIFEAFYRPDFARNRKDGGTGLGLFIVRELLHREGFKYRFAAQQSSKGMEFSICLTRDKSGAL